MKKRFEETFARAREENRAALVGFITAGDPDRETSMRIISAMIENGCDILEFGVPFSDPLADGPVIQRSSLRALKNGASLRGALELAWEIRQKFPETPLVVFSYYNPVLMMGAENFLREMRDAELDGVLCVDLPPEAWGEMMAAGNVAQRSDRIAAENHLEELSGHSASAPFPAAIRLLAPTTRGERAERIIASSDGFLYLISYMGVTGSQGLDFAKIGSRVRDVRGIQAACGNRTPICVGFGISSAEDVAEIAKIADGAIIGSAFEKIVERAVLEGRDPVPEIAAYTRELHAATYRK